MPSLNLAIPRVDAEFVFTKSSNMFKIKSVVTEEVDDVEVTTITAVRGRITWVGTPSEFYADFRTANRKPGAFV
jgi:hypothetical protein